MNAPRNLLDIAMDEGTMHKSSNGMYCFPAQTLGTNVVHFHIDEQKQVYVCNACGEEWPYIDYTNQR